MLASAFGEPGRIDLAEIYDQSAISTYILAEIASKLQDRKFDRERSDLLMKYLEPISVALTISQAIQAGRWRDATRHLGLSLGDRCCLALAHELGAEAYTADRVWAQLDLGVTVRVIR